MWVHVQSPSELCLRCQTVVRKKKIWILILQLMCMCQCYPFVYLFPKTINITFLAMTYVNLLYRCA